MVASSFRAASSIATSLTGDTAPPRTSPAAPAELRRPPRPRPTGAAASSALIMPRAAWIGRFAPRKNGETTRLYLRFKRYVFDKDAKKMVQ